MQVFEFVKESNLIEGINHVAPLEVSATEAFLSLKEPHINDLTALVHVYQPDAVLRDRRGLDVRVGNHYPPKGDPTIRFALENLLKDIRENAEHPYILHQRYETLHPFTDGNGRSGRALWAWQMVNFNYWPGIDLKFLHAWYYQSLEYGRK